MTLHYIIIITLYYIILHYITYIYIYIVGGAEKKALLELLANSDTQRIFEQQIWPNQKR